MRSRGNPEAAWIGAWAGLATLLVVHLVCAAELDIAVATPEETVRSLQAGLVEVAADPRLEGVAQRYEALLALVEATHDLPFIAELTIRRAWDELTEAQQAAFVGAFTRLSVMSYASRFAAVGERTFEFREATPLEPERMQVSTLIHREGATDIPLEYLLHVTDSGWKIINIVADGVSDLALKRSEYRRILQEGSIEDLVAYVERQAEALERH